MRATVNGSKKIQLERKPPEMEIRDVQYADAGLNGSGTVHAVEKSLIMQCAPLFADLRISALYMAQKRELKAITKICSDMGIRVRILGKLEDKWAVLLYNRKKLSRYFKDKEVKSLLKRMGYKNMDFEAILSEFTKRYNEYAKTKSEFPHEMGLVLGYPLEDVRGYIAHNGKDSLYTGCWKVYSNLEQKIGLFYRFEKARLIMLKLSNRGMSLEKIAALVKNMRLCG